MSTTDYDHGASTDASNNAGAQQDGNVESSAAGSSSGPARTNNPKATLFMTNLSFRTSWYRLKDFVKERVGTDVHVSIPGNKGRSRGIAFLAFETEEQALEALPKLDGVELEGRVLSVRRDIPKEERPVREPRIAAQGESEGKSNGEGEGDVKSKSTEERQPYDISASIFITNLPWTFTWRDLKTLCAQYGEVLFADIYKVPGTFRSRGVGTVRFSKPEEAHSAVEALNETDVRGRTVYVRMERART